MVAALDRALVLGAGAVAVVCITVIGLTLLVSVVLRYVSGSSLPFATELPAYLFPWLVCSGIVSAAAVGGHLAVDYFVLRSPAVAQRIVHVATWALVVVVLAAASWWAFGLLAGYRGQRTPILGWPSVGGYVAYPICLALLAVHSLGRWVAVVLGLPAPAGMFADDAVEVSSP